MGTVRIAPMNRLEGHMDIDATTDTSQRVNDVRAQVVMFRGLENVMIKRDPRDGPIIAPRT